jgi:hypothetical protein
MFYVAGICDVARMVCASFHTRIQLSEGNPHHHIMIDGTMRWPSLARLFANHATMIKRT